jgi:hypothetical protein
MEGNRIQANVSNIFVISLNNGYINSDVSVDVLPNNLITLELLYFDNLTGIFIDLPPNLVNLMIIYSPFITSLPNLPTTLMAINIAGLNLTQQTLDDLVDMFILGSVPKNSWQSGNQQTTDIPSPSKIALLNANVNSVYY